MYDMIFSTLATDENSKGNAGMICYINLTINTVYIEGITF
jgi:hypothetical protein